MNSLNQAGITAAEASQRLGADVWEKLSYQMRSYILTHGLEPDPDLLLEGFETGEIKMSPQLVGRLRASKSMKEEG